MPPFDARHSRETSPYPAVRRRSQSARQGADEGAGYDLHFGERADETRRAGEALNREADDLACQSWNERMWSDGCPADPSPNIDQAIIGGFGSLEIRCSRCRSPRSPSRPSQVEP